MFMNMQIIRIISNPNKIIYIKKLLIIKIFYEILNVINITTGYDMMGKNKLFNISLHNLMDLLRNWLVRRADFRLFNLK